jgi:hypothetical protein
MGMEAVFGLCAVLAVAWFFVATTMQSPRYLSSHLVRVGPIDETRARHLVGELTMITGVAEAVVIAEDGIAYLKVDLHALDREALKAYSVTDEDMAETAEQDPAAVASKAAASQTN